MACRLVRACGQVAYPVSGGRPKIVRYCLMEPISGGFEPSVEIDQMRWVTVDEALRVVSYEEDRTIHRERSLD